jgi:hypothetical protein
VEAVTRDLSDREAGSLAAMLDRAADQLLTGQNVEVVAIGLRHASRRLRGTPGTAAQAMLADLVGIEMGADVLADIPRPGGAG